MNKKFKRASMTMLAITLFIASPFVISAEEEEKKPPALMSETTYNRLTVIQELMENQEFDNAQKRLENLLPAVRNNPYEYAVTLQTFGYLYIYRENWEAAGRYLQQTLDTNALPDEAEKQVVYTLAQIYSTLEQFARTVQMLTGWFEKTEDPPAQAYILMANALAALNRFRDALPYVKLAIQKAEKPREDWYKLLLAVQFELKQYRDASGTLEIMVSYWPEKKQYWKQLSSIYLELRDDKKALATMSIAYRRDMLDTEKELLNLARLYILMEAPFEGGKVIDKGINDQIIEPTLKNLEVLAQAWLNARENDRAVLVLGRAGSIAENGELYLRQAQLYAQSAQWGKAIEAATNAIEKGELKKPGKDYMVQGTSAAESKRFDLAVRAFRQARIYDDTRRAASQWLEYINQELALASN